MRRLMRKTSGAKMYCALEAPIQDRESGTLTCLSVVVGTLLVGHSTRYCIYHTGFFPLQKRQDLVFRWGSRLFIFVLWGFRVGFFFYLQCMFILRIS